LKRNLVFNYSEERLAYSGLPEDLDDGIVSWRERYEILGGHG